jgi:hypothetical protein
MEPGEGFTLDGIKPKVLLSETNAPWSNGAYLAVSLVYVGGLPDHADLALPLLRQLSMPATFFIDPLNMLDEVRRWEHIRATEHEIALAPFMGAQKTGFLPGWTQGAFGDEVRSAKRFCRDVFSVSPRSLYHSGPTLFGDKANFSPIIEREFDNVVTSIPGTNGPFSSAKSLSSRPLISYPNQEFRSLLHLEEPNWLIIPFGPLFEGDNTRILMHRMMLESLNRERKNLRIGTVSQIAAELRNRQSPVE